MKIHDNRKEYGEIEVQVDPSDNFSTFGGEYSEDHYDFAEYGLDCGEVSFYGLTPRQYKNLGLTIINHLMINGHDFEIGKDHNGVFLKEIC